MKKKINNQYILFYLISLLFISYFFLYFKHQVGNDSTVSEWLINYEGGFTRRGFIGQIVILLSRLFESDLRWTIFLSQSFFCTAYFFLLWLLLKDLKTNRIINLSIFTPIFILYPIAEIEVLARKEIIVFTLFLIYILFPLRHWFKNILLILFSFFSVLTWEPVLFFFPLIFLYLIIENKIDKVDFNLLKFILLLSPGVLLAFYIIANPLSGNQWEVMASVLNNEFNEKCYMSCGLLKTKSTLIQQFQGNVGLYTFEAIFRYSLIIIIGFYPLALLLKNSEIRSKNLVVLKNFKNLLIPICIAIFPAILLFAMGYDWGRWVNISYVILALIFFTLLNNNKIALNINSLKKNFLYKLKGKVFAIFFLIFCFGWNPKTVMLGDVASFPGYRIPVKIINKVFTGEY